MHCIINGEKYVWSILRTSLIFKQINEGNQKKIIISIFDCSNLNFTNNKIIIPIVKSEEIIISGPYVRDVLKDIIKCTKKFNYELRIGLLKEEKIPYDDWVCSICLTNNDLHKNTLIKLLCCNQVTHESCIIDTWLSTSTQCPLCRCVKCPFCMDKG